MPLPRTYLPVLVLVYCCAVRTAITFTYATCYHTTNACGSAYRAFALSWFCYGSLPAATYHGSASCRLVAYLLPPFGLVATGSYLRYTGYAHRLL